MEENKSNEQNVNTEEIKKDNTINTEEVKKEAKSTFSQVKSTIRNTNFKKDANEAKGFFIKFFKNPLQEIDTVAHSKKNEFLKIAIIILVIWLISALLGSIIDIVQAYTRMSSYYSDFGNFFKNSVSNIFDILTSVAAPLLSLVVLTLTIYFLQKSEKKSFVNIASTVLVAKIPVVIGSVFSLLEVSKVTSPFSSFCNVISSVLLYFAVKYLFDQKDDKTSIIKFAIVMAIYYVAGIIISLFGISI